MDANYRVRAIVEFHEGQEGKRDNGHYTCWVRGEADDGRDHWTEYDDAQVLPGTTTLPARVHRGAYLIAYERAGSSVANAAPAAAAAVDDEDTAAPMEVDD